MNFNIYLKDELSDKLQPLFQTTGKSCNALIREAIQLLISQHQKSQWSQNFLEFQGLPDTIAFESYRDEL